MIMPRMIKTTGIHVPSVFRQLPLISLLQHDHINRRFAVGLGTLAQPAELTRRTFRGPRADLKNPAVRTVKVSWSCAASRACAARLMVNKSEDYGNDDQNIGGR
jgi:hypothetical protein